MSGHSKWSKVKHQKASTDAVKSKQFTKISNAITVAVKQGGGNSDPSSNFKLRLAIEKAREINMPKDKIEKAIGRGLGKGKTTQIEEVVYEAFAPNGIGLIIEVATDNKQRTVAAIKNILERGGGTLAISGAVSHYFNRVGAINISKNSFTYDEIMEKAINCGASDLEDLDETFEIYADANQLQKVKDNLNQQGLTVKSAELIFRPNTLIRIEDYTTARELLKLLDNLEEIDDVQKVSANFDIPDRFLR